MKIDEMINTEYQGIIANLLENGIKSDNTYELLNYHSIIENPLKTVITHPDRKTSPYYLIGELLWYLSGSNKLAFIEYYSKFWSKISDDGITCRSAYGARLFNATYIDPITKQVLLFNQIKFVTKHLKQSKSSRQAIIHLHLPNDMNVKDELCTLTLQFLIRNNKLNMIVNMRSNDIILGYTNDIFMFSAIMQVIHTDLLTTYNDLELGTYYHNTGSMHIYDRHFEMGNKIAQNGNFLDLSYKDEFRVNRHFLMLLPKILHYEYILRTTQYDKLSEKVKNNIMSCIGRNVHISKTASTCLAVLLLYAIKKSKNKAEFNYMYISLRPFILDSFKILIKNLEEI